MTQTQKRLTIIELAISITDIETINLQILKLQPLRSDIQIDKILSELKAENYAQAKKLIAQYHLSPNHTIVQRIPIEELEIIDSFDFLEVKTSDTAARDTKKISPELLQEDSDNAQETEEVLEENRSKIENTPSSQPFDTLLNIDAKSVLEDNIALDIHTEETQKEKIDFALDQIPQDTFLDTAEDNSNLSETNQMRSSVVAEDINEVISQTTTDKEAHAAIEPIHTEDKPTVDSYILLKSLENTYPPIVIKEVYSQSLKTWLDTINKNEYDDDKIDNIVKYIGELSQTDKAEAAQFLLATSITKAPYAQFILARALYKGTILSRNLDESFRIMSQLTHKDHYPQAYCDLAQFFENGITTKKNKKEALNLYKEAMDLGVQRAQKHYERLKTETSGFFSFFK